MEASKLRVATAVVALSIGLHGCLGFGGESAPAASMVSTSGAQSGDTSGEKTADQAVKDPVTRTPQAASGATITPAIAAAPTRALPQRVAEARKVCHNAKEANADRVRFLQTELMVAAIKCHKNDAAVTQKYNQFVAKFGKELVTHSNALQAYFKRTAGKGYLRKFDTYVTALANEVSMRSQNTSNYCGNTAPLFDAVLAADKGKLDSVEAPSTLIHWEPASSCKSS